MKKAKRVNLGCGSILVDSPDWLNFDCSSSGKGVKRVNLLGPLPLNDRSIDLIYSSHFFEHIPRRNIPYFLSECYRVLKVDGIIRLVMPDLENIAREYLLKRDIGDHEKADFVVLELIDQCVRRFSGGELGRLYGSLRTSEANRSGLFEYIYQRMGEDLRTDDRIEYRKRGAFFNKIRTFPSALRARAIRLYIAALVRLTPTVFREQNVSLAGVGELHHWVWDFWQLRDVLISAGFQGVTRCTYNTSAFHEFPFYPLDIDSLGNARKGAQSMYVEAFKSAHE
jgi:SAM-dependent methyltransferase